MKLPDELRWKSVKPEETLGQGGQAQVIAVIDGKGEFKGKYALKAMKAGKPKKAYERFEREITAVKALSHPAIIKVFDHSKPDEGFPFYVMEYVEGVRSLKKLIGTNENPFASDPLKSVLLFQTLADAIRECERNGIVHRDLSPANILMLPDESIRVIDFGICQIDQQERITLIDEGVGTQNYMAPECESGSHQTATSVADLYSAGKIMWSAITNRLAFAREKPVFGPMSMKSLFPESPEIWHLHHIYEGTIRQNPSDRWQSADQARAWALHVRRLIAGGYLPIENIGRECPFCGIGSLERFGEDWQVFHNPVPHPFVGVRCNYCGLSLVRDTAVVQKLFKRRDELT